MKKYTHPVSKLLFILIALLCIPNLVKGQFKDFRKLHTENFDPNKWSSGAAQYYENGFKKYEYEDIGKGKKKRFEYFDDGSLMSELEVVFKFSRDTAVVIDTDTYQEMIQIVERNEMVPDGNYLEYHKGSPKGKRLIHQKGQFRNGKKTGTWTITTPTGQSSKMVIGANNSKVNHTDYASYKSIQAEKKQFTRGTNTNLGPKPKGNFKYKNQQFSFNTRDGLFGVVDEEQNEIIPPFYRHISTRHLREGILILQDEKLHVFDLDTRSITASDLDDIQSTFRKKIFLITKENKKGIIDPDNKQIAVPAKYNHIQAAKSSYGLDRKVMLLYSDKGIDLYYKTKSGGFHHLDNAYQSVTTFSLPKDNYALVEKNGTTELVSLESSKTILELKNFQDLKIAPSGHVFLQDDDSWSVFQGDFSAQNPGKFEDFYYVNNVEAHIEVKQNGLWGALDQKSLDTLVIPCQYDSIAYTSSKMYKIFNEQGKVGLINYAREVLVPMKYDDIYTSYSLRNKYWVKDNGKYRLSDGKPLNLFEKIITYFNRNLYIVENEGNQGLYSESDNQLLIPCEYDSVYRFTKGRTGIYFYDGIALRKGEDIFISNLKGEMLSEYPFKSLISIPTGCEIIAKDHNEKSHVIANCTDGFKLPPPVDSIRHVEEGAYVIADNAKFGFFSSGELFDYEVMLPMEYDEILWYLDTPADGSKLIMAKKDGKWLWINPETGKNNFQYTFDSINRFYDGRQSDKAKVVFEGKKKILRLNGTLEDR